MNNRTQQRFDRSIREAIADTVRIAHEREVKLESKRIAEAKRLLPQVEKALYDATGERRTILLDLQKKYHKRLKKD